MRTLAISMRPEPNPSSSLMAEPSPLYSLDVLQHAFVEMGLLRTKEVAQVCRAWAAGAQAAHSWWRGLLSAAEAEKERGNDCFRRGDTVSARNCYSRALEMLDGELRHHRG